MTPTAAPPPRTWKLAGAMIALRQLVECLAILEVVYYYLNDDESTLHADAWSAFKTWNQNRRSIHRTLVMIDDLPETGGQ